MSKFDDFMKLMNQYMSYHGFSLEICSDMRLTSYSGESKVSLVDSDIRVMDMDIFASLNSTKYHSSHLLIKKASAVLIESASLKESGKIIFRYA